MKKTSLMMAMAGTMVLAGCSTYDAQLAQQSTPLLPIRRPFTVYNKVANWTLCQRMVSV